jgi:hypothetical protein
MAGRSQSGTTGLDVELPINSIQKGVIKDKVLALAVLTQNLEIIKAKAERNNRP